MIKLPISTKSSLQLGQLQAVQGIKISAKLDQPKNSQHYFAMNEQAMKGIALSPISK
jgi:hypothetical protein